MKKIAILIDGGWFCKALGKLLKCPGGWPTVDQLYRHAMASTQKDEEIFRIFYYDCEPYGQSATNPIDKTITEYGNSPAFRARKAFFFDLSQKDLVALRRGEIKARGWQLQERYKQALLQGKPPAPLQASDIYLALAQKGVDMRIGIDVATLSLKKLVDRIVLFSGDTDMIPAMKLARREGIQVFLASVSKTAPWKLKHTLVEDSDGVRHLTLVP
jgi:uncharacterized LabA/DUF88 family protein